MSGVGEQITVDSDWSYPVMTRETRSMEKSTRVGGTSSTQTDTCGTLLGVRFGRDLPVTNPGVKTLMTSEFVRKTSGWEHHTSPSLYDAGRVSSPVPDSRLYVRYRDARRGGCRWSPLV